MITKSLERQSGASTARAATRGDFLRPNDGITIRGSTQLIRAVYSNDLPRVLQLIQLGAPLELMDMTYTNSALL